MASPAVAEALLIPVAIAAGPLPACLKDLERQTGIELLYDGEVISGLEATAVEGSLTTEAALRQLLAGTDLTVRRAASGAWIIERPATVPLAQQDAPVAEILVIGRRTQNTDIRRSENDVQPYTVATRETIVAAHRDDIDQYFTSRITANTTVVPASQSQEGNTLSDINLRGLGSDATLVLIDGRRMPSIPVSYTGFRQSDLNAIPLHAIKRIEVLTGAAGGIHGFGALGGVVNVILDRDSRGIDVHVTQGISSRGDSPRYGVEASFGKTYNDGATDFTLFVSHSESETVLVGAREYAVRDRQRTFELAPQTFRGEYPYGGGVSVRSFVRFDPVTGDFELFPDLIFKPEFGGAALSSDHTFIPVGFSGDANALVASLTRNAGQQDFSNSDFTAQSDLGSNPRASSILANIRHRFGERLEAFADAVVLRNRGETQGDSFQQGPQGTAALSPESPANPFIDYVNVYFPIEQTEMQWSTRVESTRYTAGVVAELPSGWRGTAELSSGEFRDDSTISTVFGGPGSLLILEGDPSDLDTNPFGDWSAFQRAINVDPARFTEDDEIRSRFRNQSLRFAGPVFNTSDGPATLTLLAEHRKEDVPHYTQVQHGESGGITNTSEKAFVSRTRTNTSLYGELRTRLFNQLEFQLAVRRDEEEDDFAKDPYAKEPDVVHARFTGTAYTVGAKYSPTPWLMLRGSYATGEQPPPLIRMLELTEELTTSPRAADPKRGGTRLGADGAYLLKWGGNSGLKATRANTGFLGAVLTPAGVEGPRLAIDYSRIRRTRDVQTISAAEVMAHEDFWPSRVERAALTDADRANGYTAGRVTLFDMRALNGAALEVDSVDLQADWPLSFLGGRLQLYADATYHMRNVQRALFEPDISRAGYRDGPLKRRANGGFDWSTERLTIGANLQYFGSYLVIKQGQFPDNSARHVELQGSTRIPSQSYLDLHGTWRLPVTNLGPLDDLSLDLGVINALDKTPPRESSIVNLGPGYSRYGDPRQRRFELALSAHF